MPEITQPTPPTKLVSSAEELASVVEHLRHAGTFAFDTEFIGENTYHPILCLIQVATRERVELIDPLAISRDAMKPFWQLLADESLEKVCHAGDQDVEIVWQHSGLVAHNMFDTQIGAGMLGISYPTALWRVVEHFAGITLEKAHTYSAWDRRPLTKDQFEYAIDDVRYLPAIHQTMKEQLAALGHFSWMRAACDEMCQEAARPVDARRLFAKIRGAAGLNPGQLSVLREITALREQISYEHDVPARAFLKDEAIFDMASRLPQTPADLARIRDVPREELESYGEAFLQTIRAGLAVAEDERRNIFVPGEDPAEVKRLAETLWVAAQAICLGQRVTPGLVTTQSEIAAMARLVYRKKLFERHPLMQGWHRECLGEKLEQFIAGRMRVELTFSEEALHAEFSAARPIPLALKRAARYATFMCGIAGIVKFPEVNRGNPAPWQAPRADFSALDAMSKALAHRGPDGDGLYTDPRPGRTAALVHRRLAIIDLPCGRQPMANEDQTVQVVFNGEIYNHAELRRELQSAGHVFKTDHSDTEVLVHGWEQWGTDLPSKLLGMFAFAIWDIRGGKDTLFLARDRMGQKPLFYATLDDGLVFGSTIPSILAWSEVPRRVPRELIALYLQLGYLPPPHTIYRDISQVVPGHWLRVRGDVLDGNRYWSPLSPPQRMKGDSEQKHSASVLRENLSRAVESQLIADVPVACFLSGGIDSSIIAALMQKSVLARGGDPIHTVSVGFQEGSFDETDFAAAVARRIGSRHTRLEVRPDQHVPETLQLLMRACLGQPFADSSILPTYHLSKAVRQVATVALSGDGADELFAGYDRYRALLLLERWSTLARFLPRQSPLGPLAKQERYRRLANAARGRSVGERYARLAEIFPADLIAGLLGSSPDMGDSPSLHDDAVPLRLAMLTDQQQYLPGDVLWKVDSASMSPGLGAHAQPALEVRSPFLDHHIVEFANSLEPAELLGEGRGKHILRQEFTADLPPEILSRSKKGFGVPIGEWFRTTLRTMLHDALCDAHSFGAQHLSRQAVEQLLREHDAGARDHTHRLFALFMLELWAREFSPSIA